MFTRFSRSWELIKASGAVLRQDKELLLFPFFSAIATLLVSASFIVPLVVTGALEQTNSAALYRYATDGNVGESFSSALLGEAFRPKR